MRTMLVMCLCFLSVAVMAQKETDEPKKRQLKNQGPETVIELESYIVGDKEQPAVSYFVPWQGTSAPDKLHWNIEDKNDKTLDLVDRDVMLRSIDIYNEMNLETQAK